MLVQFLILLLLIVPTFENASSSIFGAWKADEGVVIFSNSYFAYTAFRASEFEYTYGGSYEIEDENIVLTFEFHTKDPLMVGTTKDVDLKLQGKKLSFDDLRFSKIDDGSPGKLAGAWLFTNRVQDGKPGKPRSAENPRKTMKILSGSRFQWIAYNVSTREFMGTGGGTYTTIDGKYTENIDFFSRDNSRVGASLVFDFELKGDDWHHKGFSSRGDPIFEIWSRRQ